jgi:hypothetical protein
MADSRWEWSRAARRYRDTDSGKFLPAKTITTLRDNLVDARAREIARVTQEVADGKRQVVDWLVAMREQVKIATLAEYTFGRGGRNALEQSDFGRVCCRPSRRPRAPPSTRAPPPLPTDAASRRRGASPCLRCRATDRPSA